ncbi:MAG TPA: DUF3987 domain-containing protein [Oligoflexus sp.]|uniref:DUF3987 domain-containing protein n=1 Tax=Oligoflexus sp. TaxID=1971216 RepID=UPI002D4A9E67|nr:DUF3987 domain-containing protein [Oligoflexus sp.]HYX32613.1 DUF3987 domain-containing protein [Oligoflexus sp.]
MLLKSRERNRIGTVPKTAARWHLSTESFSTEIAEIEGRITPTALAKYLGFPVERGRISCPYHSGDKRTMRCNDREKSFNCQTETCIAHRSEIDIVEFYCHVRNIYFSQAVAELKKLKIESDKSRPESRTSKGFATSAELLEFHKASQPDFEFKSEHVWYSTEDRAQKIVFRFARKDEGSSEADTELVLYGNYYRGKWYRTRLYTAKGPLPYNWHLNSRSSSLLVCRDELEADFAQGLGIPSVAVSSLGLWEGTHANLFHSLDIRVLVNPGQEGREYCEQVKRDLSPVAKSFRIVELPRLDRAQPVHTAESLRAFFAAIDDPWEKPLLSLSAFEAIPRFDPDEMLPESIRYHLMDLSDDLQCPIDMLAAPAIAGLSLLLGRKLTVQPKRLSPDFKVAAPLWCLLIADPGQKKTQILKSALAPLFEIEAGMEETNQDQAGHRAADMKAILAKERDLDARLAEAVRLGNQGLENHLRQSLADLESDKTRLAAKGPRQYVLRDATAEKMLEILVQNPNGVMQLADEVPGWWRSLNTSHIDMRKLFLEGWGGLKILVQRKSYTLRGDSILSVVGGAQPGWVESLLADIRKGGKDNDGLINRFSLLINHEPLLGVWEYVDRGANPTAKEWYETIFGAFHELKTEDVIKDWQAGQSNSIRFSAEAQEVFIAWITEKENAIREGKYSRLLASHVSKYTTLFASLALVFHIVLFFEGKTEDPDQVSIHAAQLARKWCDYLFHHAHRTFSDIKSHPLPARSIAHQILIGEVKDGTLVSALQSQKNLHLHDAKERRKALKYLAEKKLIRVVGVGDAERIRVNPHELKSCQVNVLR